MVTRNISAKSKKATLPITITVPRNPKGEVSEICRGNRHKRDIGLNIRFDTNTPENGEYTNKPFTHPRVQKGPKPKCASTIKMVDPTTASRHYQHI